MRVAVKVSTTPASPSLNVGVSVAETELVIPARSKSEEGASEIEADNISANAARDVMLGVRANEADWVKPARSWSTAGARDTAAETVAKKAATPLRAGLRLVEIEFVTPAMSSPSDCESDSESAFATPPRSWLTDGASDIEAEMVEKNARAAVRTGDRPTVKAFVMPPIPWVIAGVSAMEAVREARKAATPVSEADSAVETDWATPAKPAPREAESDIDSAVATPSMAWPKDRESDREAGNVAKKAKVAATAGESARDADCVSPPRPSPTPAVVEMDAASVWRYETVEAKAGIRYRVPSWVRPARPTLSPVASETDAAFDIEPTASFRAAVNCADTAGEAPARGLIEGVSAIVAAFKADRAAAYVNPGVNVSDSALASEMAFIRDPLNDIEEDADPVGFDAGRAGERAMEGELFIPAEKSTPSSTQPHVPVLTAEAHVPEAMLEVVAVAEPGISYSSIMFRWYLTVPAVRQVVAPAKSVPRAVMPVNPEVYVGAALAPHG